MYYHSICLKQRLQRLAITIGIVSCVSNYDKPAQRPATPPPTFILVLEASVVAVMVCI